MIANAVRLDPKSADLKVEMAYQFYLSGNYARAYDCYQVPPLLPLAILQVALHLP